MDQQTVAMVIINMLTIIPPTIMAYASLRQGQKNEIKTDKIDVKQDEIISTANEIHVSTDGNLTAVRKDLETAKDEIRKLNELVARLAEESKKSDTVIEKLDKLDGMFEGRKRRSR